MTETPTRGAIIDHEVDDATVTSLNNTVGSGDVFPMLVVAVDEETGTYGGVVFLPGGSTTYVVVPGQDDTAPNAEADWKFDPRTGAPIPDPNAAPSPESLGWKYDPETGKPYGTPDPTATTAPAPPPLADTNDSAPAHAAPTDTGTETAVSDPAQTDQIPAAQNGNDQ